jgi:hypothetical protein
LGTAPISKIAGEGIIGIVGTDRDSSTMKTLRCFAEGYPGHWEAICLDLDIAVQGKSMEEVFHSLSAAIDLYLEHVQELPENERAKLLNRQAPWPLRLRFFAHVLRVILTGHNHGDGKARADFLIPCMA